MFTRLFTRKVTLLGLIGLAAAGAVLVTATPASASTTTDRGFELWSTVTLGVNPTGMNVYVDQHAPHRTLPSAAAG